MHVCEVCTAACEGHNLKHHAGQFQVVYRQRPFRVCLCDDALLDVGWELDLPYHVANGGRGWGPYAAAAQFAGVSIPNEVWRGWD